MNAMNYQASRNYQKVQVESASPEKLVLMLYDGAVRKLSTAETAFESGDLEAFHENVVRVQKIVTELLGALDTSKGGDLAGNLQRIYDYMLRQLSLAIVRRNLEQVSEVRTLLEELREGWQGLVQQQSGMDAVEETAPTAKNEAQSPSPLSYAGPQEKASSFSVSG